MNTPEITAGKAAVDDFINYGPLPIPKLYGSALVAAAQRDPRIVCLTADLTAHTEVDLFRDALPDRFFQVGIAEANMIGIAGGMARMGDIPFIHSFCCFATKRCFNPVTMQVAYPRLPVKIVGFLPGVTTLLGVSHQAIEDLALMRAVPNMAILAGQSASLLPLRLSRLSGAGLSAHQAARKALSRRHSRRTDYGWQCQDFARRDDCGDFRNRDDCSRSVVGSR